MVVTSPRGQTLHTLGRRSWMSWVKQARWPALRPRENTTGPVDNGPQHSAGAVDQRPAHRHCRPFGVISETKSLAGSPREHAPWWTALIRLICIICDPDLPARQALRSLQGCGRNAVPASMGIPRSETKSQRDLRKGAPARGGGCGRWGTRSRWMIGLALPSIRPGGDCSTDWRRKSA